MAMIAVSTWRNPSWFLFGLWLAILIPAGIGLRLAPDLPDVSNPRRK